MSITPEAIWAPAPATRRGLPTILSCDPKGEKIAYASNKSIFIRTIDQPEISKQYTGHIAQTTVARFSPSGFYIASGDVSGSIRVWDAVGEGATKGEYHIIAGRINDIAWDGDSQRIIGVGEGKERFGHCITADSGNSVGEISGQSAQINCVSIRQQRPLRAATGSDDTSVAFYHGAPFKFNTSLRGHHNKFVYGTAFSPDGSLLVSVGSDRKIWLFDGKTGEPKGSIGDGAHTGSIFSVSWSKDSKSFATCSADQTVKIWDVEAGKSTHTWRMGGDSVHVPSQQVGLVWPHGRTDGLVISIDLEGNLNYLLPDSTTPSRVVRAHQGNITALGLCGTSTLVTGSFDGAVRSWNVASGVASAVDGQNPTNYVSGFSSSTGSSGRIYGVSWDDTLRSIDTSAGTFTGDAAKLSSQPKGVAITRSGLAIVATASALEIFSADEKVDEVSLSGPTPTSIAASSTSDAIVIGCSDNTVKVYDVASKSTRLVHTIADASLTSPPSAIAFSANGAHVAVGTSSGRICVFAAADWSLVTSRWSAHAARVTSIAWSPDSAYAASGSLDTNVFVWSLKTPGARVKVGGAHKDGVNGVAWLDDRRIVTAGGDAAVKVWKVDNLK